MRSITNTTCSNASVSFRATARASRSWSRKCSSTSRSMSPVFKPIDLVWRAQRSIERKLYYTSGQLYRHMWSMQRGAPLARDSSDLIAVKAGTIPSRYHSDAILLGLAAQRGVGLFGRFTGAGSLLYHPSDFDRWDADAVRWAEEIVKAI